VGIDDTRTRCELSNQPVGRWTSSHPTNVFVLRSTHTTSTVIYVWLHFGLGLDNDLASFSFFVFRNDNDLHMVLAGGSCRCTGNMFCLFWQWRDGWWTGGRCHKSLKKSGRRVRTCVALMLSQKAGSLMVALEDQCHPPVLVHTHKAKQAIDGQKLADEQTLSGGPKIIAGGHTCGSHRVYADLLLI
jgi:hypothetical protein